jgi:hypothetical protein
MPRYSAQVDYNPQTGIEKKFHRLHDGGWAYETIQHNTSDILDFNKERQNHDHCWNADKSARHVASIPLVFIQKWFTEYGIDYWNPDHQDKVDALLDSSEWRWLRTTDGTISKKVASKAQIENRILARSLVESAG